MATLNLYSTAFAIDMNHPDEWDVTSMGWTDFQVDLASVDHYASLTGTMQRDIGGTLIGGTVTGYKEYFGNFFGNPQLQFEYSGLNVDLNTLFYYSIIGDFIGQQSYMLRFDDEIISWSKGDVIRGFAGNDISGNAGNDFLYGDEGNDRLNGGTGNDVVVGGDGDDYFVMSLLDGDDTFTGGNGWDIIDYSTVAGVVQINQFAGTASGSAGIDILGDVFEQIIGSNLNDVLAGGHGINCIDGAEGDDLIWGNGGTDLLRGGPGNDTFYANVFDGDDRMLGGDGWDVLDYSATGGSVTVNQLAGTTSGSAGNDELWDHFEEVRGTAYNDLLAGSHESDVLKGNGGSDQIFGNNGNDTIYGGAGSDLISLGLGNDTYVFIDGDGDDTITDFVAGAGSDDVINVHNVASVSNFAQVSSLFSQVGADTVINFGGGNSITLLNVSSATLHQDDFIFV